MPYIIYFDLESLIEKRDGCVNNPEKSSTTKIGEHIYEDIHCQLYELLIIQKISILYNVTKILYFFKRTCYQCN